MRKLYFITTTLIALGLLIGIGASNVTASQKCEQQYGGQTVCVTTDININKKVSVPKEAWKALGIEDACKKTPQEEKCTWRDNFVLTDSYKFSPGQDVTFQITIENVSKKTFGKVEVRDFLPSEFTLVSDNTKFNLENFQSGEKKSFFIDAKVAPVEKLGSKDQEVVCPVNKAEVWSDVGTFQGDDTAQICVAKKAKIAKVLPKTGPEHLGLYLFGFLTTGAAGMYLLRKFQ